MGVDLNASVVFLFPAFVVNDCNSYFLVSNLFLAFEAFTLLIVVIFNLTISVHVLSNKNQAAYSFIEYSVSLSANKADAIWKNFAFIFSYSKVIDSQCSRTLSYLSALIREDAITIVSGYKFKVVNETTKKPILKIRSFI